MGKLSNLFNQPLVRFSVIALLFFIMLRVGLALANDFLGFSPFLSTLLALLVSGLGAYKIIWRRS